MNRLNPSDNRRKKFITEAMHERKFYEKKSVISNDASGTRFDVSFRAASEEEPTKKIDSIEANKRNEQVQFSSFRTNDLKLPSNAPHSDPGSESKLKSKSETKQDQSCSMMNASSHRRMLSSSLLLGNNSRRRYFGERVPEVHLIGEIIGGTAYSRYESFSCSWSLDFGHTWTALEGSTSGQTQYCTVRDDGSVIWNHPFDIHLTATTLNGWPRLLFRVWRLDRYGRINISGYGYCSTPSIAGTHNLTIECWIPCGSFLDEIYKSVMGISNESDQSKYIFEDICSARHKIVTRSAGKMTIRISVLLRYFDDQEVDL